MNTKFAEGNVSHSGLVGAIKSAFVRRTTISGIALTTLLASNGAAFAAVSTSATSYQPTSSHTTEFLAQTAPDAQSTPDAQSAPDAQSTPDAQIEADPANAVERRKPTQFKATVDALTPYVVEGDDGSITIEAPPEVINSLDKESYTAVRDSIDKANQILKSDNNTQLRRLPPIPPSIWKPIWNLVKKRKEWVWYKVHLCVAAVTADWYRITAGSPDPHDWIVKAAYTCGRAMRK